MTIYITMIIMIIMFSAAWLTMPLTTLNVFFSKAYPMSVSPSIDFLLRWDHHLHHHHHNFFCLQFHRSNGVVHVHVWLCQAVQPPSLLKSADYLLNTGDYPGIHSQVSFRYIWWWYDDDDDDKDYHHYCHHDKSHDHNVIFSFSIIVENCAVICMWGGDWWANLIWTSKMPFESQDCLFT